MASEEHMIVDCALPSRIVHNPNLGVVALPQSPLKTTAIDCWDAGGRYRVDDPRWPLEVWTEPAEHGDAAAQYHVGETYERGFDAGPDYAAAVPWYRRAAEQRHRSAAANLARLYERGAGVPLDWVQALDWYQVALSDMDAEATAELGRAALRRFETREHELRDGLQRLRSEPRRPVTGRVAGAVRVAALTRGLVVSGSAASDAAWSLARADDPGDDETDRRIAELEKELQALEAQGPRVRAKVVEMMRTLTVEPHVGRGVEERPGAAPLAVSRRELGKFYAVVIANEHYREWPRLETPINDASDLKQILEERYGFERPVEVVRDADQQEMLQTFSRVRAKLQREADHGTVVSFVLFYAGHGATYVRGHWIPVDASRDYSTQWIPDVQISEQMRALQARQVLVIADSCYASTLATRGIDVPWVRARDILKERPRFVMSSGDYHPVYEAVGARHSVFATALIDVLRQRRGVVRGEDLFHEIQARVRQSARTLGVRQEPQYLPILDADHVSGDFVLVAGD